LPGLAKRATDFGGGDLPVPNRMGPWRATVAEAGPSNLLAR